MQPLILLFGPTASGKSALALAVAQAVQAEVIGCDSVQIYKGFDIGSGKLPLQAREGVPHHLIDIADAHHPFTAGDYLRLAREGAGEISARGRIPVVVGGTGFYLRAFLEGLCPAPARPEMRARLAKVAARRPQCIHPLLARRDPASAARIHPKDVQKALRALEVALASGEALSSIHGQGRDPLTGYRVLKVGLNPPRAELREAIAGRCEEMMAEGLMEETRRLLESGYTGDEKPFASLGYAQCVKALRGELSLAQALEEMIIRTRQYAKRQMTWFRREPDTHWFGTFGTHPETRSAVLQIVDNFLK